MKNQNLNTLVKISVLGAMALVLMMFEIPLPLFPNFLKIDFSDIPALLGAFALGPVAGVVIEFLKNVLNGAITGSTSMWVGELANFLVGSAYVFTAGYIYKKNKSKKTAVQGMILGIIAMIIIASIFNYYVLIPFYAKLFGMQIKDIVAMAAAANPKITDLTAYIVWAVVPFNALKGIVIAVVTAPLYKKVSPLFHRDAVANPKEELNQM
ncbi:ECF transporter S component [Clostridium sp. SYSU_GA19001]|uniref:ECF transporter S component n=1 Tax=Clostridium caldaquaticum TaxID=2940653 RepID=UPI002077396B|nr:ECF transporter S component [Clostridium caldaquaticum]MCM8709758.1 ECF transporter S component [Clostridium caldaquaticum]